VHYCLSTVAAERFNRRRGSWMMRRKPLTGRGVNLPKHYGYRVVAAHVGLMRMLFFHVGFG
jgi:hypothetical protein